MEKEVVTHKYNLQYPILREEVDLPEDRLNNTTILKIIPHRRPIIRGREGRHVSMALTLMISILKLIIEDTEMETSITQIK